MVIKISHKILDVIKNNKNLKINPRVLKILCRKVFNEKYSKKFINENEI